MTKKQINTMLDSLETSYNIVSEIQDEEADDGYVFRLCSKGMKKIYSVIETLKQQL